MDDMKMAEYLWEKFNEYKETAEQHEFVRLIMLDMKLVPAYNDLKNNYDETHAKIFINVMKKVLDSFGIKYSEYSNDNFKEET